MFEESKWEIKGDSKVLPEQPELSFIKRGSL